ncbi:MAG TPA: uracil-DNA glycosylase [Bacilli bacterium]
MSAFQPVMLPEEPAPLFAVRKLQDDLALHKSRIIWGEGNSHAPVFVVLDNPGCREDRQGKPFVCGTRETLQRGLFAAGLEPEQVYVSYILKYRPTRAYNKPAARERGLPLLKLQLAEKKPSILLGLGDVVVKTLLQDETAQIKSCRGVWHLVAGIPAAFSFHPLAVRRRPVLMKYFLADLRLVAAKLLQL